MKKHFFLVALFSCLSLFLTAQTIEPAPADKAVVYFVRPSSLGYAINFTYFDGTKLVGKFKGPKYIRYECEPGEHLFWARSENRDFVEAVVEAGKIYFLEAKVRMGAIKAGVELVPVDGRDPKKMEKILKLLGKKPSESFTEQELQAEAEYSKDVMTRGMDKYTEDKAKGKVAPRLEKDMFYGN